MTITSDVGRIIADLRQQVCDLHAQLTHYELVIWTAGNVSARVPDRDLLVIKPSGADYDSMTADDMVVCDLHGNLVDGALAPSSDTAAHAYVYRHMPEVGGVVHTHSTYATAWAARGEPIPCVLTMAADEFGGRRPDATDRFGAGLPRSVGHYVVNHDAVAIRVDRRLQGQARDDGSGERLHFSRRLLIIYERAAEVAAGDEGLLLQQRDRAIP